MCILDQVYAQTVVTLLLSSLKVFKLLLINARFFLILPHILFVFFCEHIFDQVHTRNSTKAHNAVRCLLSYF